MTRRATTTGASARRSTWPLPMRPGWRCCGSPRSGSCRARPGPRHAGGAGMAGFAGPVHHHGGHQDGLIRPVPPFLGGHGAAMRLIHTSDWHLGRSLHGENLLEHQAAFLDWLLGQAVAHRADAVLVAGDVYDRAVPAPDAVALLSRTLESFARARIPMIITSGNHDSAIRLGFGSRLSEAAGIHLRTSVADIPRPVIVADEHGEVAMYGIPYLLPDAVMADLGAERSHAAVLSAAVRLIREDASARGIARTVVAAHAFVTGAQASESERDIRVGGIGDAPGRDNTAACSGAEAAARSAREDRRSAGPGRRRPGRPGRRLGQGRAHRHRAAGLPDGAAAREMAAHPRPGLRPRRRPARLRRRPGAAG